jgi:hypothetical protein
VSQLHRVAGIGQIGQAGRVRPSVVKPVQHRLSDTHSIGLPEAASDSAHGCS